MACMTHCCIECHHEWFDNYARGYCPECSGDAMHFSDELPDGLDEPIDRCNEVE